MKLQMFIGKSFGTKNFEAKASYEPEHERFGLTFKEAFTLTLVADHEEANINMEYDELLEIRDVVDELLRKYVEGEHHVNE